MPAILADAIVADQGRDPVFAPFRERVSQIIQRKKHV
jgi:hypothetical protein